MKKLSRGRNRFIPVRSHCTKFVWRRRAAEPVATPPAQPRSFSPRDLYAGAALVALLAFAGPLTPQEAMAACSGSNTITCTPEVNNYPGGISYTNRNNNTTVIVQSGTTIQPASGNTGINLQAGGLAFPNLTVNSQATITTTGNGADGINVSGGVGGNRTVTSVGNITTNGNNAEGINATGGGIISVTQNGTIQTNGTGAEGVNAVGTSPVTAILQNRSVSVTVTGDITTVGATSTGVNAVRLFNVPFVGDFDGYGDIAVDVNNVTATGAGSLGINATNAAGNIDIAAGNIISDGTGVNAQVKGVSVGNYSIARAGNIDISTGNVTSNNGNGVNATTGTGTVSVQAGDVTANNGLGVNATTDFATSISLQDLADPTALLTGAGVTVDVAEVNSAGTGINAQALGGNVGNIVLPGVGNITARAGDVTSTNANGINATTGIGIVDVTAGDVTAENGFGVNATTWVGMASVDVGDVRSDGLGINAQVTGGNVSILTVPAIGIASVNAGNVTSTNAGGVNATTGTGAAIVTVNNVNSAGIGINAVAGTGLAFASASDVTTTNAAAHGMNVQAGGVAVAYSDGLVSTTGDGAYGVNVVATPMGNTGPLVDLIDEFLPPEVAGLLPAVSDGVAIAVVNDVTTTGEGAVGVNARADEGIAGVLALGTVQTTGENANGIQAFGAGFAGVIANDVSATGLGSQGIIAAATDGPALVLANSVTSNGAGITATADNGFVGVGVVDVTTTGADNAGGIIATIREGDAYVAAGTVQTVGTNSTGIYAETEDGSTYVVAGDVTTQGANSAGIVNLANGTSVTLFGNVTTAGAYSPGVVGIDPGSDVIIAGLTVETTGYASAGILGLSDDGDVNVAVGAVSTTGHLSAGIVAGTVHGDANILVIDSVTTSGDLSAGIVAGSLNGDANVGALSVSTTGEGSAGILALSGGDANVLAGEVTTTGDYSAGILAASINGDANVLAGEVMTAGDYSAGIVAGSYGGDANAAAVSVSTTGDYSAGILAASILGDANVLAGEINTAGNYSAGIVAGSYSGNANVGAASVSTTGDYSAGILAGSITGDVNIASLFTSTEGLESGGIVALAGGDATVLAGAVYTDGQDSNGIEVLAGGDAFVLAGVVDTDGDNSEGIVAEAIGDATVIAFDVETLGDFAHGVRAFSSGGATNVAVGSVDTAGLDAHGIDAFSANGATTVFVGSSVYGGDGVDGAGVVFGGATSATLVNIGSIGSRNDRAIVNDDRDSTVLNLFGTVTGHVEMGAGDDDFYNVAGAFVARGDSDFGDGNDLFYNAGVVTMAPRMAPTTVSFDGLETFDNDYGVIWLANDIEGDLLRLPGDFIGGGALYFDAYLGGPGSTADMLEIDGAVVASGQGDPTALIVNDTNSGGFGGYVANGIEVVDVSEGTTNLGDFYLYGGPIDKGLFVYDLILRPDDYWVLQSTAQDEVYEMASLMTGAQNIWYTTAGAWHQRTNDLRNAFTGNPSVQPLGMFENPEIDAKKGAGNGVWARAIGDWGNYDADNGVSYRQDTYALQAGLDGSFDFGRGTMIAGMLGGFVKSNMDFKGTSTEVDYSGATGGAYLTYLQDAFYIDALVKADMLNTDYKNTEIGASAGADAITIGVSVETGYKFNLTPTTFIEPQAQLSYVSVQMDDMDFDGTGVDWNSGDSLRGRLGARLGTSITQASGAVLTPYVKASVINEFAGDNKVNVAGFLTADDTSGTWGEVGGGLQFHTTGSVSGYVDGTYWFGSDNNGGTVTGGLRHAF